jgi:hypothetical protein
MRPLHSLPIALIVLFSNAGTTFAVIRSGMVGDGRTSIYYVASIGEFGIQPDGHAIGFFEILSASGIFTAEANLPPNGLGLDFNTNDRKAWASLPANAFTDNFSLGDIAAPGLSLEFLLNDLFAQAGGGFGTPKDNIDFVYFVPEPATAGLCGMALFILVGSGRHRVRAGSRRRARG